MQLLHHQITNILFKNIPLLPFFCSLNNDSLLPSTNNTTHSHMNDCTIPTFLTFQHTPCMFHWYIFQSLKHFFFNLSLPLCPLWRCPSLLYALLKKCEIIFQVVGTNRHLNEVSESDPFPLSTMAPAL